MEEQFIDTAKKFVENALTEGSTAASTDSANPIISFPRDLEELGRPYVQFSCMKEGRNIFLPMPAGITIADGGEYSTINTATMSALAQTARAGVDAITGQGGGALDAARAMAKDIGNQAFSGGGIGAAILLSKKMGLNDLADTASFAGKMVVNPRTNVSFSGNNLRQFGFKFTLIGRDKSEVNAIDAIQNTFRNQVYASEMDNEKLLLKYPNQWQIKFFSPDKPGKELDYIPKIYTSYLTSCSVAVNPSSPRFRTDNSPYELTIDLAFQETKILTRDEIQRLENGDRTNREADDIAKIGKEAGSVANKAFRYLVKSLKSPPKK
jgi:hypothetical protein